MDDDGFSLTELLVVVALLGMVLAIAWNLHSYMAKVNADNEREAYLSTEVGTPLMGIDKLLMQNSLIEGGSGPYRISFLTDVNADDVRERNVITASGGTLRLTRWTVASTGVNDALIIDQVYSTHNVNVSQSQPLFTYLDSGGDVIADTDLVASKTRTVTTTIVVDYGGTTYADSRETHLRNRD